MIEKPRHLKTKTQIVAEMSKHDKNSKEFKKLANELRKQSLSI